MLTDAALRQAAHDPTKKVTKLRDREGLYVIVRPDGAKYWRWDYRFGGRRKTLSLGIYPSVTLSKARGKCRALRELLEAGQDPSLIRRREKVTRAGDTVRILAGEWLAQQARVIAPSTKKKIRWILDKCLLPSLGSTAVSQLQPLDVLRALKPLDRRGVHETAHRAKQTISQILRYAVATGRASRDVTADIKGALTPVKAEHYPAVTDPGRLGALLRAIDGLDGHAPIRAALRLAPLVFVRPGELRKAEWAEFDLEASVWRIPAARMKMREPHIVPLATQAVTILKDLQQVWPSPRFVFPSVRTKARPMSNGTLNAALRRLGYTSEEMTGHGFRAIASTRLNELGWAPDLIELQLAHKDQNAVRDAYNRAVRLEERTTMMQAWADYLDGLKRVPLALVKKG